MKENEVKQTAKAVANNGTTPIKKKKIGRPKKIEPIFLVEVPKKKNIFAKIMEFFKNLFK